MKNFYLNETDSAVPYWGKLWFQIWYISFTWFHSWDNHKEMNSIRWSTQYDASNYRSFDNTAHCRFSIKLYQHWGKTNHKETAHQALCCWTDRQHVVPNIAPTQLTFGRQQTFANGRLIDGCSGAIRDFCSFQVLRMPDRRLPHC